MASWIFGHRSIRATPRLNSFKAGAYTSTLRVASDNDYMTLSKRYLDDDQETKSTMLSPEMMDSVGQDSKSINVI